MSVTTQIYVFEKEKADKEMEKFIAAVKTRKINDKKYREPFDDIRKSFSYNDKTEVLFSIISTYLDFGSYADRIINSPVGDFEKILELELMTDYFKLDEIDINIPSKKGFLDLYTKIMKGDIIKMAGKFSKDHDCDKEDGEYYITDALQYLHPIAKELKENIHSVLIVSHDYEFPDIQPQGQNTIIRKRADEIIRQMENDEEFMKIMKSKK